MEAACDWQGICSSGCWGPGSIARPECEDACRGNPERHGGPTGVRALRWGASPGECGWMGCHQQLLRVA
eukprot:1989885-Alexandrium_andersonii.AAC.1